MKTPEDKNLEKIIDKVMNDSFLETPSPDFTSKVMSKVIALKTSEATTYKPLISKTTWFIIFSAVMVLFGYIILKGDVQTPNYFGIDLSFKFDYKLMDLFPAIKLSKTAMYATLILLIMMMIEIPLLKNHFEKQYTS